MPQLGEAIAEATILNFLVKPGDPVENDQDVLEVETNKASMNVSSPARGKVDQWLVQKDESYAVGEVLGYLEVTEEEAARLGIETPPPQSGDGHATNGGPAPIRHGVEPTVRGLPVPANIAGASYVSPRMKARMHEVGLHAADMAGIAGSGAAGRVTVEDLEQFLENLEQQRLTEASSMRVAVADAMRRSWTRPLATVGLQVRLDPILAHRKQSHPKAGPALYGLRALAIALAENSAPAGRLVGSKIVHPPAIDIGVAVEVEDGVLVPVIRGADKKTLQELLPRYNELVEMARDRKLPADATGGSIATVTNYGTFGLMWATPIPLPEQTLVLGMGTGRRAPHWDVAKQQFVPIVECTLTLSFDHRVLDGGAAGRLLQRVANLLQHPDQL